MLVILAGILPTTAAFTNTEMGRQWFQKAVGWTIAFILYKPAAAIVYSVAFLLMGNNGAEGFTDHFHHRFHADDRRAVRSAGADAFRHPDGRGRRLRRGSGSRSGRGGHGHRCRVDGPQRAAVRATLAPHRPVHKATSQARLPKGSNGTPAAVTAAMASRPPAQPAPAGRPARAPPEAPHRRAGTSGSVQEPAQAPPVRCRVGSGESRRPGRHGRRRRSTSSVQGLSGRTTDRAGFNRPARAPVAAINTEYKEPSYGNWRVPRSAGLGKPRRYRHRHCHGRPVAGHHQLRVSGACSRACASWPSPGRPPCC